MRRAAFPKLTILAFVLLLFTNVIFVYKFITVHARYIHLEDEYSALGQNFEAVKAHMHIPKSPYASLVAEIPSSYYEPTPYNDPENEESANEHWESIDFNTGIVALSDEYAESKGLPLAQRFPWDQTKGIYLINAHHHLHCLKSIHRTITQFRNNLPQTEKIPHVNHCLDALRRQVICDADDTPRVTTVVDSPNSGVGQIRQCKSWEKLEEWAAERTACFRYNSSSPHFINNFKNCPEGSPYIETMKGIYGDDYLAE